MPSGSIRVGKLRFGDFSLQTNADREFQIMNGCEEMMGFESNTPGCPPASTSSTTAPASDPATVCDKIQQEHGSDVEVMMAEDGTFFLADSQGNKLQSIVSSDEIRCIVQSEVAKSTSAVVAEPTETVTYLSQKDFDYGCYFICKPGKYVLTEHIVCDYFVEHQLNADGTINAKFTGNSNSAVASIGIAVVANDVEIDGQGYSIKQSGRSATQNRIFTAISLSGNKALASAIAANSDNPTVQSAAAFFANNNSSFGGGGPSDAFANEFDIDIGCENVHIHDLDFGRSSHFHIHGTNNRGVTINKCRFFEFEVAAIWLNNHASVTMEDLDIVGMDKFEQSLTQLWAFRAQGTGVRGIVNASYWGIILNQQQGGVNVIFPGASGNTLTCAEGGQDRQKILALCEEEFTHGGVNKQRVGPRGPVMRNIRINELKSQMISGYCLAREDATGNTVPILFDANAANDLLIGGGGHMGYRAKYSVQIEAVKDGYAWYPNVVSWLWYKDPAHTFQVAAGQTALDTFLTTYKVVDEAGADVTDFDAALKSAALGDYKLVKVADGTVCFMGRDRVENVRLADRAFVWAKDSAGNSIEGMPKYTQEHVGFYEYRGKDANGDEIKDLDAHIFNYSNVYKSAGASATMAMGPYPATQVTCKSAKAQANAGAMLGQAVYYESDAEAPGAAGFRATKVLPIIGSMLANHAGDMTLRKGTGDLTSEPVLYKGWWDERKSGHQTAEHLPIDFGGHQMNGVVSIHCDRVWGGVFEDIDVINAANLRTDDYLTPEESKIANQGTMKGYTHELDMTQPGTDSDEAKIGFAGSSWSMMLNDSGGNLVRRVNSLNMLARNGASFAIHMGFGSRGNVVEDCHVLSNTGGEMWGFVADKGAIGNYFRRCTAQDIVGAAAAGGFVIRGNGNLVEDCKALGVKVIAPATAPRSFGRLAAFRKVSAGFLCDFGGADENEFRSRYRGSNTFRRCEANGVLTIGEHQVDRNAEIIYRKKAYLQDASGNARADLTTDEAQELADLLQFEADAKANAETVTSAGFLSVCQAPNHFEECTARYIRQWGSDAPDLAAAYQSGDLDVAGKTVVAAVTGGDAASYTDAAMVSTPWKMTL